MTREEALNKAIAVLTYHQVNFCKSKEAVANMNEIIEALEKIDQEQCGDCIRRSDIGLTDFEIVMCNGDYKEALKMLLDKIEKAPSVTPMPKMGHWEWNQYDANPQIGNFHCSLCHSIRRTYFDYCPYCGAKAFLSKDVVDGFYFGWSVGCPRACINDKTHKLDEDAFRKARLTFFNLYSKEEAVEVWNNRCKEGCAE